MLLVTTTIGPSAIAGLGLFAAEPIAVGQVIWQFEPKFDLLLDIDDVRAAPKPFRAFFDMYCYEAHAFPGSFVLLCDHAKFINHAEDPNIASAALTSHALREIAVGDEITSDYRAGFANWPGFDAPPVPT